mgnify:CR=1 FL=1
MVWVIFAVVEIVEYGKVSNSTRKKREADRHFMRKFVELTKTIWSPRVLSMQNMKFKLLLLNKLLP